LVEIGNATGCVEVDIRAWVFIQGNPMEEWCR